MEYSAMRGLINDVPYAAWRLHLAEKEKLFSCEDWQDSAMLGALESVRSGVTTIADITKTGAVLRATQAAGLRAVIYREVGTMDRSEVDQALADASSDIDAWRRQADADLTTIGIAPSSAFECHPLIFKSVAEYAADGTPVACHMAGSREEYDFIRFGSSPFSVHSTEQERGYGIDMPPWLATGVSPVRYILNWGLFEAPNVLAIHCVQVDDDDIAKLAEYDIAVAVCSRCNAQLAMGIAPLSKLIKAGIRVGLGTDSPAAIDSIDPLAEMRIGLLMQRALGNRSDFFSSAQMVRLATLGAAEALRIEDGVGSLDVGNGSYAAAHRLQSTEQRRVLPVLAGEQLLLFGQMQSPGSVRHVINQSAHR
jgi:5-methylthioadenosine/S-adenosylhomocysteine deaminase